MKISISTKITILTIATIVAIIVAILAIPKNQEMLKFQRPTQTKNK